ncbi:MAG: MarR family transcriptional regulator [Anaerolineales bacterium]|nr:MarR family transcriptional regulator [Anaerolineales bacterium]
MPTHFKGTPQEVRALNTFIKLTRASDSLLARLSQRGTQGDLTPSQFAVLEVLYHLGPMCQSEIGAKLLKSSGNITLVIDNLEKHSLVRRARDQNDRRMIQVLLTDKGRALISQLFPGHLASIVDEMSVLEREEQETLGHLCRKLGLNDISYEDRG